MYLLRYRIPRLRYVHHFVSGEAVGWRFVSAAAVTNMMGFDTIVGWVWFSPFQCRYRWA